MKYATVALILMVSPVIARGDSIDDVEAKRRGIPVEMVLMERQLLQANAKIAEQQKQIVELQTALKQLQQQVPFRNAPVA